MKGNGRLILLLWGTLLLLLLLISSLPDLQFAPSPWYDLELFSKPTRLAGYEIWTRILIMTVIPLLVIALLFYLPELRSRLKLIGGIILALILFAIAFAWGTTMLTETMMQDIPPTATPLPQFQEPEIVEEDAPAFESQPVAAPPARPDWVSRLTTLSILLIFTALLALIVWILWPRRQAEPSPLLDLSQEAETAVTALQSGHDWRNVVLRCYADMGEVLTQTRGIKRPSAMTPREFETQLTELGLPDEPVSQLTRLFEQARYSPNQPGSEDEQRAITSLTAVAHACQELS